MRKSISFALVLTAALAAAPLHAASKRPVNAPRVTSREDRRDDAGPIARAVARLKKLLPTIMDEIIVPKP
jgi:hypothetical protein